MKKILIIGGVLLITAAIVVTVLVLPSTMSKQSFEGLVTEAASLHDGETRIVVQRTTEIYDDTINALHISESTKLIGVDGNEVSAEDIQRGQTVRVTLHNSFNEGFPIYYPTVYTIEIIG